MASHSWQFATEAELSKILRTYEKLDSKHSDAVGSRPDGVTNKLKSLTGCGVKGVGEDQELATLRRDG
ncbi:MAG: hypothetical protein F6K50_47615 [Moorea sp. SIO3I7]|nr:hypothetical protein [Moorena sp. SIO3I7]